MQPGAPVISAGIFDRADAVKGLVDWLGDIHQPFHAIERDSDEAGNNIHVLFFKVAAPLEAIVMPADRVLEE
jgi:hypothetical protein